MLNADGLHTRLHLAGVRRPRLSLARCGQAQIIGKRESAHPDLDGSFAPQVCTKDAPRVAPRDLSQACRGNRRACTDDLQPRRRLTVARLIRCWHMVPHLARLSSPGRRFVFQGASVLRARRSSGRRTRAVGAYIGASSAASGGGSRELAEPDEQRSPARVCQISPDVLRISSDFSSGSPLETPNLLEPR